MNPALLRLQKLHELDKEVIRLRQTMEAEPEALRRHEQNLAHAREQVKNSEAALTEVKSQADSKELDLKSNEDEILRLRGQLSSTKNIDNKTYKTFLSEIEGKVADNSVFEDEILELMTKIDEMKADLSELRENVKKREADIVKETEVVNADVKKIKNTLTELENKRAGMAADIDEDLLHRYERVLGQRGATAIVDIREQACQGCFTKLTLQHVADLLKDNEVVFCKSCGRVLVLPDEERSNFEASYGSKESKAETQKPVS